MSCKLLRTCIVYQQHIDVICATDFENNLRTTNQIIGVLKMDVRSSAFQAENATVLPKTKLSEFALAVTLAGFCNTHPFPFVL